MSAHEWVLSREGEARCGPLAERLAAFRPALLAASPEPKARRTAELVATRLGLAVVVEDGLREHDRAGVPFLRAGAFEEMVSDQFARPTDLVFGRETVEDALARFSAAVDGVLARRPDGSVVIAAHGTAIALFTAASAGVEPFPLWRRRGLPSCVVRSLPGFALQEVVADV